MTSHHPEHTATFKSKVSAGNSPRCPPSNRSRTIYPHFAKETAFPVPVSRSASLTPTDSTPTVSVAVEHGVSPRSQTATRRQSRSSTATRFLRDPAEDAGLRCNMNLLDKLRNDIEGVKLLNDWIGEGGQPVSSMRSEHRAAACVSGNQGQPCPFNVEPGWWERVKSSIAQTIQAELELKHHLELRQPLDDGLHMCSICGCCLKLKVWTPIQHIQAHTSSEMLDKMPGYCWQKREIKSCQTSAV